MSVSDYVLQKFKSNEKEILDAKEEEIFGSIREFLRG
jgi:peptidyl-tRNA hydrolase